MKRIIFLLAIACMASCGNPELNNNDQRLALDSQSLIETIKYAPGDPFIETIKESEFFKMSGLEDKIIETSNGTVISIPKGAFKDAQGNIVEKEVTIEITDIASFEEQFKANINSPVGQEIILNGGALYFNATQNGVQLGLNDDSPIYVEANQAYDPDLLTFEGIRNDQGEMQWINPEKPAKYLIPVELSSLDFLPAGFAEEVKKNLPFDNYKEATKSLIDSLYYSLISKHTVFEELPDNGVDRLSSNYGDMLADSLVEESEATLFCGAINPAVIKVIRGNRFENTLISTKQFESRMQTIHQSRKQAVLDIYISNISEDLSECDKMAAALFSDNSELKKSFNTYASEGWGNIKDLPRSVQSLGKYYSKQLKDVEKELTKSRKKYEKALQTKSEEAAEIVEEYKEVLVKRQRYRLTRHGYKLTKTGWVAPGRVIIEPMRLEITVDNGADYDRVHVYTIDPRLHSIFAWQSMDKVHFDYVYPQDDTLVYAKGIQAKALVVAYRNDIPYFDLQDFTVTNDIEINFTPDAATQKELDRMLKNLDRLTKNFNKVTVDLEYQAFFYDEKERLKKLKRTNYVMNHLYAFVYSCGDELAAE